MGLARWYDERVLPRVISLACGMDRITALRRQVVPLARGSVLEIGCGGGLNLQFYQSGTVDAVSGIDPNCSLLEKARREARDKGWDADIREGAAEDIPFPDKAFDTVVCTYTLCSVNDPKQVLAEMRRVLKPGGMLLFLEHGRAPDARTAGWQRRIEPIWKRIAGNCHLTRDVSHSIRAAGFEIAPIGRGYLENVPRWAGWMEWGSARRTGV